MANIQLTRSSKKKKKQDCLAAEIHWPADLALQMWENIMSVWYWPQQMSHHDCIFAPSENEDYDSLYS